MRLKNRVALVTGAASGIGREIARTFVREGAKVVIADLNQAGADAPVAELGGPERRAIGLPMDVTSEEQIAVGAPITERPPHRSERARFGHSARPAATVGD
jgi:3-hydroxybutyrate dehydrogenase